MRSASLLLIIPVFALTTISNSQSVTLRQVGKNNLFLNLVHHFNWRNALYSIDNQGVISKTDLDSGIQTRVGKATYNKVKSFFGLNARLYIIENDGSMTEIDPVSGDFRTASSMGEWSAVDRAFVVANSLYSIENGSFYYHRSPSVKTRDQRGGADFFEPGNLMRADSRLFSLFRDGTLYQVNTANGEWKTINKSRSWRNLKAAQVLGDKFYAVDVGGHLISFSLVDKTEKTLDNTQFTQAKLMFAEAGRLFVIMNDGGFYEVKIGE
jgi:hypothetical protein